MRKQDIKVWMKLYKQSMWDIFEYEVIQIQTLQTKDHKQDFYIVKCNSCVDHESCEVALKINDTGHFEYSHMINNYEDEYTDHCKDCKINSQYYWHIELWKIWAKVFFLSKKDCIIDTYERTRDKYDEDIKELELKISTHKKNITLLNIKLWALDD